MSPAQIAQIARVFNVSLAILKDKVGVVPKPDHALRIPFATHHLTEDFELPDKYRDVSRRILPDHMENGVEKLVILNVWDD